MNDFVDSFANWSLAYWLVDYYLATTALFGVALAALALMKQPAQRMAVVKAALFAAVLLTFLCAVPGWSLVHLATTAPEPPRSTTSPPLVDAAAAPSIPIEVQGLALPAPLEQPTAPAAVAVPKWSPSWLSILLAAYLFGSVAVLLRLVLGMAFARRLLKGASPAPAEVDNVLTTVLAGERWRPRLLVSREIDVAAALGVVRPTVLLPSSWALERSPSELRTVLAHECAHVRNGDLKWLAVSRIASVVLWLQPLYWLVRRRMRLDQETLADAAAAELSSRVTYAEQLVKWARAVPSRPRPALASAVGLWESPSQLRRRVAVLLDEHFPVLRECSSALRWSSLLMCGFLAIALSAVTFQPTLSESTEESTIPDRLIVGDSYVLCKVTTELQQSLLANDSWPQAEAAACLLVNNLAFSDEKFDAESPVFQELSATLAQWAKVNNSRLIATVHVKSYTDNEAGAKARKRADELAKRLQQLGTTAGFRQSICGVTYLADSSFDWQKFVKKAEELSANSTSEPENGVGNDRVRLFAVKTFLSRLLVTADCVIDIVPVLQAADTRNFPQTFQSSIDEFVPQLKYGRQDQILLRVRSPMSIRQGLDAWVEDGAGRWRFASELGFKECNLSTSYVAEPDSTEKTEGVADRADLSVVAKAESATPDSSGGITHDPLGLPVAEDELAGVVLDEAGQPLADVKVDVWTWHPGNEVQTDKDGRFKLKGFEPHEQVQVKFSKAGYCPKHRAALEVGRVNWVVKLDNRTYLEGRVTGPDGKPIAGANVRATRGPFQNPGVRINEVTDETVTDVDGQYRLFLEPDIYDIQMRVPGNGVARRTESVLRPGVHPMDIQLKEGPTFRAVIRDSITNEPVSGIRLWNWRRQGIEGTSNADGIVEIANMLSGPFSFDLTSASQSRQREVAGDYARWWSADAISQGQRIGQGIVGEEFQRNFDELEFDVRDGMEPVTIIVERAVTIRGQVLDPDGMPVAGATVAPAKTGSGNSITGDTRYSVQTHADGKFEMRLPASGAVKYNLVAHDGKYTEWRKWANGVGELLQTKPGDELTDVTLRLSPPCTVGGRVLDAARNPVANHPVRAHSADKMENRYYDPTTKTNERGEFVLKFVRPGKQYIQADPFYLVAEQGPAGGWKLVEATPEEAVEVVELRLGDDAQPSGPMGATLLELRAKSDELRTAKDKSNAGTTNQESNTQHHFATAGTIAVFVAGRPATPWDYKPNTLAFALQEEGGGPVEGIEAIVYRVTAKTGDRSEIRRAKTDAHGEVEFTELMEPKSVAAIQGFAAKGQMPDGVQDFFITVLKHDGLATIVLPVSDFTLASRGVKRKVRMRPAAELNGRVTDRAGKPVEGALVVAGGLAGIFPAEGINAARTDADGHYRIGTLPAFNRAVANQRLIEQNQWATAATRDLSKMYPEVYDPGDDTSVSDVKVTHPDYAVTTFSGGNVPGTTNIVMAPAAAIDGRVVEYGTGKPAAGVRVELFGDLSAGQEDPASWHAASTITDAAGTYRLGNLPEGKYEVWAEESNAAGDAEKRVSLGIQNIAAVGGAAPTRAPDLVLGPGGTIHGRLIDASTGKPLTNADGLLSVKAIAIFADGYRRQSDAARELAVDREGRFNLQVVPGKRRVLLFVYAHGADSDPQGDYRSADDTFDRGPIFELQHGESTEADFQVWPKANIEVMRAKLSSQQSHPAPATAVPMATGNIEN